MRLDRPVTLSLSLESSSGPSDTPAKRVDPLAPMMHGKLRNTSAPMPPQPYSKQNADEPGTSAMPYLSEIT